MRFEFEQSIRAQRTLVESAFVDPAFYDALGQSPNLRVDGVLERIESASAVTLKIRFAFIGSLSGAVRAVIDPAKLTWVTVMTVNPDEHHTRFEIVPDHYPDRLECSGGYQLLESESETRQLMTGDILVHVPVFGRSVERAILSGFRQHVSDEASLIATWAP